MVFLYILYKVVYSKNGFLATMYPDGAIYKRDTIVICRVDALSSSGNVDALHIGVRKEWQIDALAEENSV